MHSTCTAAEQGEVCPMAKQPRAASGNSASPTQPATQLDVEWIPTSALVLDAANLRKHPEKNLEAIKASIKRFGFQKPIVIGKDNTIIAGNGTLTAAKELGIAKVPCVRSELGGAERVAYAIADNRTNELSEWDDANLLQTLQAMDPDDVEAAVAAAAPIVAAMKLPNVDMGNKPSRGRIRPPMTTSDDHMSVEKCRASASMAHSIGVRRMPRALAGRSLVAASARACSRTVCANTAGLAMASTRRQSTAF